jgi:hypothetical protein
MGAAAATQCVLTPEPPESNHHVTIRLVDGGLPEPSETPQTKGSAERDYRYMVRNNTPGRLHPVFAAEQMNFMPEVAQTFGSLK